MKRWCSLLCMLCMMLGCDAQSSGNYHGNITTGQNPEQQAVEKPEVMKFSKGGYDWTITPLANYTVRGVVLSRKNYGSEWNSILSPCDVALAWGELLQKDLYKQVEFWQSNRWYWWKYPPGFARDNNFISRYSANTHIIPANANVSKAAKKLRAGDVVEMSGYLVSVTGRKGSFNCWWHSSLSRDDTGNGSCEVMYVQKIKKNGKIYE